MQTKCVSDFSSGAENNLRSIQSTKDFVEQTSRVYTKSNWPFIEQYDVFTDRTLRLVNYLLQSVLTALSQ